MMRNGCVNLTKNFSVKMRGFERGANFSTCGDFASAKRYKHGFDTYHKEFAPQISQKDEHRDYLKYARSVIPAKVVLAYTSDISKDRQRIEKERREFSSSVNLGALSAGQNDTSGALDSGRNGVNLGRDEFSKQNGVSQRTNDESGISWGEVFKLIANLATIAQFALKF